MESVKISERCAKAEDKISQIESASNSSAGELSQAQTKIDQLTQQKVKSKTKEVYQQDRIEPNG